MPPGWADSRRPSEQRIDRTALGNPEVGSCSDQDVDFDALEYRVGAFRKYQLVLSQALSTREEESWQRSSPSNSEATPIPSCWSQPTGSPSIATTPTSASSRSTRTSCST